MVDDGSRIRFWHDRWVGDFSLKMLYPQLYACSCDKEACISDLLDHQEDGSSRCWDVRFFRNFHEREFEAVFSFLDLFQAQIPRGIGCDRPHWCLNGNGKFDTRSFYHKIKGTGFGKSRCLRGWLSSCGPQHMAGFLPWII